MFHIQPYVQSSSTSYPRQRIQSRPGTVRFGEMSPKRLGEYQKVVDSVEELKKYRPNKLGNHLALLSQRARDQFEKVCDQIKPQEVAAMNKHHALGPIEESADMLFELYSLKALRDEVITTPAVDKWRQQHLPASTKTEREKKEFSQFLKTIGQALDQDQVKDFQELLGWDEKKTKDLLTLMAVKFILLRSRDPKLDIMKGTKAHLRTEAGELSNTLPWYSPRRLQVRLLGLAYSLFPFLPVEMFRSQLKDIVRGRLHKPVKYEDLMENVFQKQMRRQEFEYYNPQLKENNARKGYLKGIELINEAAILKDACLWHPSRITSL